MVPLANVVMARSVGSVDVVRGTHKCDFPDISIAGLASWDWVSTKGCMIHIETWAVGSPEHIIPHGEEGFDFQGAAHALLRLLECSVPVQQCPHR